MLVDSHCHLDQVHEALHQSSAELIAAAKAQAVNHLLCVCIDMSNFPAVLQLAHEFDNVSASVGVHPATEYLAEAEISAAQLIEYAQDEKIVAIGETGLDYFHHKGDMTWQQNRFRAHIAAAKETGKPLIIHMRDAKEDTLAILAEEDAGSVGGVMHCFVEDWETAEQAMALGFYISFSGIVTFKSAKVLQDVAKRMPLDRMLVETDAPYLAPMPYRGKTNRPAYVRHVAEFIADLREERFEQIAQATTDNFFRLFQHAQALKLKAN